MTLKTRRGVCVPVQSFGRGNMQKGHSGLGQMIGPKVKNRVTLEFNFIISYLVTTCSPYALGYRSNNFIST